MNTTFKLLAISSLALFSFQSCNKKSEPADQIKIDTMTAGPVNPNETSIKEAQSKPLTTVAISEDNFDFGVIKKGDVKSHTYEITNTGTNPLIISEVKPGCGCTIPEFTKDPILPGQKGNITLKFESEAFDGVVHKTADVFANTAKAPITLNFTADIK
ncbi:DUF1573 domain-containing protein [Halpernia frigidisoli]|uniref:DUF1573 domain-containing protein n=1 Tax=Halpernia frigidisoli TaxID=1125876 RepID=A0A1I3HVG7_9FLAO|nr:DUF1573 domain-containing protein [Halpernia frigidisoli]SFI39550.1 Protein of unknown function [Halpernia frigidisoli]